MRQIFKEIMVNDAHKLIAYTVNSMAVYGLTMLLTDYARNISVSAPEVLNT